MGACASSSETQVETVDDDHEAHPPDTNATPVTQRTVSNSDDVPAEADPATMEASAAPAHRQDKETQQRHVQGPLLTPPTAWDKRATYPPVGMDSPGMIDAADPQLPDSTSLPEIRGDGARIIGPRADEAAFDFDWKNIEVGQIIGKGHFGKVYKVTHKPSGRLYAMKSIRVSRLNSTGHEHEIAILRRISGHPHVTTLLKVYQSARHVYLLMELCEGGDVFTVFSRRGAFSESLAAHCMKQILLAVEYLHVNGISHRDLKPENILVLQPVSPGTSDEELIRGGLQLRLCDFGMSRILSPGESLRTQAGTQAYTSPEMASGKPYGPAVDCWAAGIIAFILLSGYHPFDEYGDNALADTRARIRKGEWSFDDACWEKVSESSRDFVSRLLQVDPTVRMTASEALQHPWLRGRPQPVDYATDSKSDCCTAQTADGAGATQLPGACSATRVAADTPSAGVVPMRLRQIVKVQNEMREALVCSDSPLSMSPAADNPRVLNTPVSLQRTLGRSRGMSHDGLPSSDHQSPSSRGADVRANGASVSVRRASVKASRRRSGKGDGSREPPEPHVLPDSSP